MVAAHRATGAPSATARFCRRVVFLLSLRATSPLASAVYPNHTDVVHVVVDEKPGVSFAVRDLKDKEGTPIEKAEVVKDDSGPASCEKPGDPLALTRKVIADVFQKIRENEKDIQRKRENAVAVEMAEVDLPGWRLSDGFPQCSSTSEPSSSRWAFTSVRKYHKWELDQMDLEKEDEMALEDLGKNFNHGLMAASHKAFSGHHELVLSPEIIWFAIAQGMAQHIRIWATELAPNFVHENKAEDGHRTPVKNKPTLTHLVLDGGPPAPEETSTDERAYDEASYVARVKEWAPFWRDAVVPAFSQAIKEKMPVLHALFHPGETESSSLPGWQTSRMSGIASAAFNVALMDAASAYVGFNITSRCGIPRFTILGSEAEWQVMAKAVKRFAERVEPVQPEGDEREALHNRRSDGAKQKADEASSAFCDESSEANEEPSPRPVKKTSSATWWTEPLLQVLQQFQAVARAQPPPSGEGRTEEEEGSSEGVPFGGALGCYQSSVLAVVLQPRCGVCR